MASFNPFNLSEQQLKELARFDLHCHSMHSDDAITKPENIVRQAKKKGLTGIAITDHDSCLAWNEAVKEGKKQGIQVIQGIEVGVRKEGIKQGELLALFLQEPLKAIELEEIIDETRQQDALIVVPHPFDRLRKALKCLNEFLNKIDAIEAVNGHSYLGSFNTKAIEFGLKNNLAMTGGSDAHIPKEIGNAFTLIEGESSEDLRQAIRQKKSMAYGRIVPLYHHAFTQLARMKLIKDGD